MDTQPTPVEELTFEEAHQELEDIVAALEGEKHALNETMALFERGLALTRRCTELLDQAELKVQQISGEGIEPFTA
jgi:exodeoxyribonuclease VII small subunit